MGDHPPRRQPSLLLMPSSLYYLVLVLMFMVLLMLPQNVVVYGGPLCNDREGSKYGGVLTSCKNPMKEGRRTLGRSLAQSVR